jgi:hypothetical protein
MDKKAHSILDSIIGILKIGNKQDKKEADIEKKERAKKRRKVRENLLESTKGIVKVGKNLVDKIVSPFSNILGAIGNFLKNVLAGVLFNVLFEWFTDKKNKKKIDTLTRFFKDWWPALAFAAAAFLTPLGLILGGLIGFLSWALPALTGLLLRNPILASLVAAGGLMLGAKYLDGDFSNEERTDEEKKADKELVDKTMKMGVLSFKQGGLVPDNQFKKGGVTKGPSHAQGGTDINVEGGEFIFKKRSTRFWGLRTLETMNRMGGMGMRSPSKSKRKKVRPQKERPQYEGGGLVEIKSMFNKTSTIPFIGDDKGKFTSSKAHGMVALDIPVNQQNTKTIVMPEKRIAKENQVATKIGSKTIPDIMIVNSSHYREMTTRSLGIHDLVGG